MRARGFAGLLVGLMVAGGCSEQTTPGGPIEGLVSLAVVPADQTLTIDGATPVTSTYQAVGTFEGGRTEDVTARVRFDVDLRLGTFDGSRFTSGTLNGGTGTVRAVAGSLMGTASLKLLFRQRAKDPGSTNLPSDPAAPLAGPVDGARAPDLVYPNDGVLVPPNLQKLEFHFTKGSDTNTLFELSFTNALTDIRIWLRCTNPTSGGCIYQPDPAVWRWIAETNRGGAPIEVGLKGTDDAGTGVGVAGVMTVAVAKDNIEGGLYYWTTHDNTSIMRYDFAAGQERANKFLGTELTGGTCIGCHALSHNGRKLVAAAGTPKRGQILLLDVASASPIVPFPAPAKSLFESWSPDDSQYVGVWGELDASDFNLLLFNGETGAYVRSIDVGGTTAHPADHPDWSIAGGRIAFTRAGGRDAGRLQEIYQGSIELVRDMGDGTWSPPVVVAPAVAGKNRYYPAFSPDGEIIVFDESTCPTGTQHRDCNANVDPSARLFAARPEASSPLVELARANAPGKRDGTSQHLTNSYPKWSPFVFMRSGEFGSKLLWLTFSSTRKYGLRNPPPPGDNNTSENASGTLIWMTGVDPSKVAAGQDPSAPAFAVPFQDLTTSNHIAQWTTRVVPGIR